MGFFSWLTADVEESIANVYSARPVKTVFLLQPGGRAPIREDAYEGYGIFGGVDAHEWLARENLHAELLSTLSQEDLRGVGVTLDVGEYLEDVATGAKFAIFHREPQIIDPTITYYNIGYDQNLPGYEKSPNELIAEGVLVRKSFDVSVPLKFSFNEKAVWEDLPASRSCPDQGYFYDDEGGDDLEDEDVL